jgi:diguanylate cyclase (GGDEF)-like protein
MGRLARRFDSFAGIQSETDQDRAILIERFEALKLQLPWLYVIMAVTVVGVQLAAGTQHPWSFAPAAAMLLVIAFRAVHWLRPRSGPPDFRLVQRELRRAYLVAALFCTADLLWSASLYARLGEIERVEVAMLSGLAAIGASCGISGFPAAARIPLFLLGIPAGLALCAGPVGAEAGIGAGLILLTLINLRMLNVRDETFTRLVDARFTVESERKRALEATMQAVDEKRRVTGLANTDPLTGVANRRGFLGALAEIAPEKRRQLAMVLIDLDGFKPINDTFGHDSGDALLVQVSRRLQALASSALPVARLGGDEFAMVMHCVGPGHALGFAEHAIAALSRPFCIEGRDTRISACAGISFQGGEDVGEAIRRADIALFDAKRRGRGQASLFSSTMEQDVHRRTSIEQALRDPGLGDEIDLLFQPIFRLDTMELTSFEALARWRHPELGWISPSEFIPITEQISVLHEFSYDLLKRAARAALEWPETVQLSFNLSAVQLCTGGTAAKVLDTITEAGLPAARLQIEVTETALLADFELARRNLSRLRTHGVRIVLDDFGEGYSSIRYLREMNFDAIKLDGSLVSTITRPGSGLPLLQGVLALCRAMGQQCVAEHIETEQQAILLRQLGCRYGQGFHLSPPVSRADAAALAWSSAPAMAHAYLAAEPPRRAAG